MMTREKIERLTRMAFQLFILLAVAFLSAITTMRLAIQGREVAVPRVTGLRAGDAQATLASRSLGMKIADRVYSDLPPDFVVRQSPPVGSRVKVHQRAHVVLSLGPQKVSVPALVGETLRAARIKLLRAGLQVGEISSVHLPEHEADQVIQQNPPPAATNTGSPRVNLLVSQGPATLEYVMPDLVGLTLPDAQKRISAAGLRLAKITFSPAPGQSRGSVQAHTPPPGGKVASGATVELQVVE